MQNRYTTKMYDDSKTISPSQIEELKEILRISPSSINSQPWKFTFVSDPVMKAKLAEASLFNNEKVLNSDTLVVFSRIDSIPLFEKQMHELLAERVILYYEKYLKVLPESEIKHWFEKQVYLALGVFLSACANMNIDSTSMEGIETDKFDQILALKDYKTCFAVAIGHRDEDDFNRLEKVAKSRKTIDRVIGTI